ncbi:MAG TPA: helix-turn-helix transcriptional regulator [Sphingomicrobium sp.]
MCPTGALGEYTRAGHTSDVLPNNVAIYRKAAGLTQAALAGKLGIKRDYVAKLEAGSKPLSPDWLEKIGDAVGVAPYLLIAPPGTTPTVDELIEMLASVQQAMPAGLPYSEWPRAVASELHTRLATLAGDRTSAGI